MKVTQVMLTPTDTVQVDPLVWVGLAFDIPTPLDHPVEGKVPLTASFLTNLSTAVPWINVHVLLKDKDVKIDIHADIKRCVDIHVYTFGRGTASKYTRTMLRTVPAVNR